MELFDYPRHCGTPFFFKLSHFRFQLSQAHSPLGQQAMASIVVTQRLGLLPPISVSHMFSAKRTPTMNIRLISCMCCLGERVFIFAGWLMMVVGDWVIATRLMGFLPARLMAVCLGCAGWRGLQPASSYYHRLFLWRCLMSIHICCALYKRTLSTSMPHFSFIHFLFFVCFEERSIYRWLIDFPFHSGIFKFVWPNRIWTSTAVENYLWARYVSRFSDKKDSLPILIMKCVIKVLCILRIIYIPKSNSLEPPQHPLPLITTTIDINIA